MKKTVTPSLQKSLYEKSVQSIPQKHKSNWRQKTEFLGHRYLVSLGMNNGSISNNRIVFIGCSYSKAARNLLHLDSVIREREERKCYGNLNGF